MIQCRAQRYGRRSEGQICTQEVYSAGWPRGARSWCGSARGKCRWRVAAHSRSYPVSTPNVPGKRHRYRAARLWSIGIDVDQFHHPVRVGPSGGCDEMHDGFAGQLHRRGQWSRHVGQHVGPAIDEALVVEQPRAPGSPIAHDRARPVWHGLRRIGNVLVIFRPARLGSVERQPTVRFAE